MWYKFNIQSFAESMLPSLLRRGILLALLRAMMPPLVWLYQRFQSLRQTTREQLSRNGQALSLVDALREHYRTHEGDIYLVDGKDNTNRLHFEREGRSPLYLAFEDEGKEPRHFYFEDEGRVSPDYYIYLPDYLEGNHETTLRLIEQYKPAGRKYQIIYYPYE